jgi:hypothetical protein
MKENPPKALQEKGAALYFLVSSYWGHPDAPKAKSKARGNRNRKDTLLRAKMKPLHLACGLA